VTAGVLSVFLDTLRPPASAVSDFPAAAFKTFWLGRVPNAAMFATTPCLSMPASAKLGRAGASDGSIHLSKKVLGLSAVADTFGTSEALLFCMGAKGLLYLDRVVGGVLILRESRAHLPFFVLATTEQLHID
jgi:hypothetical protein